METALTSSTVNALIGFIGLVVGAWISAKATRAGQPSDAKREIELINDQGLYWKTYSEAFPNDLAVQQRATDAMARLSDRVDRFASSSDSQTIVELITACKPLTVPLWRFCFLIYGRLRDALPFYAYGISVGIMTYIIGTGGKPVGRPLNWIWVFNSILLGFLLGRGLAAIRELARMREIVRVKLSLEKQPDAEAKAPSP